MNEFSCLGIERGEREWRDVSESDIGSKGGGGAERSREDKYATATPCYDDGASMKVAMNLLQRQPSVCRPAMPRTGTGLLRAR